MPQTIQKGFRWMPGLVLGLFCSRLAHEWLQVGDLGIVVSTSLIVSLLTAIALHSFLISQIWPTLFLLGYVFYPEPNPNAALIIAAFVLIIWGQMASGRFPFNQRHAHTTAIIFSGAAFTILYTLTLAPDLLPADNGEFQLIAAQLGIAHPPGFPLYTLLAYLMTRLPLGATSAYQTNLLSAFTSSATLLLVYLSVYYLTKRPLAGITAVIALGTATTFWAQATTTNIRSLTGLFAAAMLCALIRHARERDTYAPHAADRSLIWFALAAGFGLTHHVSLAFMVMVCVLFILLVDRTFVKTPRRWIWPLLTALTGLLPLLFFPLRAQANTRGATPELATLSGFLNHVLARGFRGDFFYFITPADLWQRFKVMGNVLTFQFSPWLLVSMGIGFALLLWRDRRLALLLGGSFAIHTFITATYRAPQTVEYMIPAYIPLVILLGYAIGQGSSSTSKVQTAVAMTFTAAMLVTAVVQGIQHYSSYAYLHTDTTARDYAQPLLAAAPPESVILADWHWVTPLWYLQEIEHQRPDVTIRFVYPEADLYADTWARRIQAELNDGHPVVVTHYNADAYQALPNPEPIGEAYLFSSTPRTILPTGYQPLRITLGNAIHLSGYALTTNDVEIGAEAMLTLAWEVETAVSTPFTLFAHLVGPDRQLYAQQDLSAPASPTGVILTQFRLTPRLGAIPGDYTIMIGAYHTEPLPDQDGQMRTPIASLSVQPMRAMPFTQNPVYRTVVAEPTEPAIRLVGYDWDNTLPAQPRLYLHWQTENGYYTEIRDNITDIAGLLPPYHGVWGLQRENWLDLTNSGTTYYIPLGQGITWTGSPVRQSSIINRQSPISLPQLFHSSRPILRDLVVSVRLIGYETDGYHWAWWDLHDSIPAMGAIPTLKWIGGSQINDPHQLTIPAQATPNQAISGILLLYDAFTNHPLPILDERITQLFPGIPLGTTTLTP